MRSARLVVLSLFAALLVLPVAAQGALRGDEAAVRAVLSKQAEDWNRGDMDAFTSGYKNSPDILFIGKTVRRGYDQMVSSYRKGYASRAAMGSLTFTNVEVHLLDDRYAEVVGSFHLERSNVGGGNADGIYSLLLENTGEGWKIILDHTSSTSPAGPA